MSTDDLKPQDVSRSGFVKNAELFGHDPAKYRAVAALIRDHHRGHSDDEAELSGLGKIYILAWLDVMSENNGSLNHLLPTPDNRIAGFRMEYLIMLAKMDNLLREDSMLERVLTIVATVLGFL